MPVISNNSPIILFSHVGRPDILRATFDSVIIPPAVYEEVVTEGADRRGVTVVRTADWISVQVLARPENTPPQTARLDRGETQVITLAVELNGQFPVILDDGEARRIARGLGLRVFGSVGVL